MTNRPKALMTAYAEGQLVSRELQDMLSGEVAEQRFERELREMDAQCGNEHGGLGVDLIAESEYRKY